MEKEKCERRCYWYQTSWFEYFRLCLPSSKFTLGSLKVTHRGAEDKITSSVQTVCRLKHLVNERDQMTVIRFGLNCIGTGSLQ